MSLNNSIKSLYLRNFRNYSEAEVHFSQGLNVIYGKNALGKTNLLEAIYLIATGRSFRAKFLSELIQSQKEFFFLEAEVIKDQVLQKVKISFDGQSKSLQMGSTSYSSFSPLLGFLPITLYIPQDLELIMGAPAERRRFLNLHLAQSDPLYVHHLARFHRAMKQRNALLKTQSLQTIDLWEKEMALSAEYLSFQRERMIEDLALKPLFQESISLKMQSSCSKAYLQQLQKNRKKEMELGITLAGPHRDDLLIHIEEKEAKLYASEGQKKSALTAIKLAEWERLSNMSGSLALMGFDDLESTLDLSRQEILQTKLGSLGQAFITTPHKPSFEAHFIGV